VRRSSGFRVGRAGPRASERSGLALADRRRIGGDGARSGRSALRGGVCGPARNLERAASVGANQTRRSFAGHSAPARRAIRVENSPRFIRFYVRRAAMLYAVLGRHPQEVDNCSKFRPSRDLFSRRFRDFFVPEMRSNRLARGRSKKKGRRQGIPGADGLSKSADPPGSCGAELSPRRRRGVRRVAARRRCPSRPRNLRRHPGRTSSLACFASSVVVTPNLHRVSAVLPHDHVVELHPGPPVSRRVLRDTRAKPSPSVLIGEAGVPSRVSPRAG